MKVAAFVLSSEDLGLLRTHPLLADATPQELALVSGAAQVREWEALQCIAEEGAPCRAVFFLLRGSVRVFHAQDDREITVKHLHAPCTFGELEVLGGEPLMLESVEALVPCKIVEVAPETFLRATCDNLATIRRLLSAMARAFCGAARNERAVFYEVEPRLASLLLTYAMSFGKETPQGLRINLPLTRDTMAKGLGVVTKSVSRALTKWRNENVIGQHKGWYVLLNVARLEDIARGVDVDINYTLKAEQLR